MSTSYRYGDAHPTKPGFRFNHYKNGKERWFSPAAAEKNWSEEVLEKRRQYWRDRWNKGTLEQRKRYTKMCNAAAAERRRQGKLKEFDKQTYWKNRDKHIAKKKAWHNANKERVAEWRKSYYEKNKARIVEQARLYAAEKRKNDPLYLTKHNLRSRIGQVFKAMAEKKPCKTETIIGVPWEEACKTIEQRFQPGMTWSNKSEWHIDHKVPLALAKTKEDLVNLCHISNMFPEWKKINLVKNRFLYNEHVHLALSLGISQSVIDDYPYRTKLASISNFRSS